MTEGAAHPFFNVALDGGTWSAARPSLPPGNEPLVPTEQEARLVPPPTVGLEAAGKRQTTALAGNRIVMPRSLVPPCHRDLNRRNRTSFALPAALPQRQLLRQHCLSGTRPTGAPSDRKFRRGQRVKCAAGGCVRFGQTYISLYAEYGDRRVFSKRQ